MNFTPCYRASFIRVLIVLILTQFILPTAAMAASQSGTLSVPISLFYDPVGTVQRIGDGIKNAPSLVQGVGNDISHSAEVTSSMFLSASERKRRLLTEDLLREKIISKEQKTAIDHLGTRFSSKEINLSSLHGCVTSQRCSIGFVQ